MPCPAKPYCAQVYLGVIGTINSIGVYFSQAESLTLKWNPQRPEGC